MKPDVRDYCRKCYQPIFRQSSNAVEIENYHVDGTKRLMHKHCPKRPELWELRA